MPVDLEIFKLAFWNFYQSCSCPFWWEYWVRQVAPKMLTCPRLCTLKYHNALTFLSPLSFHILYVLQKSYDIDPYWAFFLSLLLFATHVEDIWLSKIALKFRSTFRNPRQSSPITYDCNPLGNNQAKIAVLDSLLSWQETVLFSSRSLWWIKWKFLTILSSNFLKQYSSY